ncbi:MAG: pyruvate, phosphate dikinase, partial [Planctomycetota bacterium]
MKRDIYFFAKGRADGRGDMKEELGGKGAGLAEMCRAGIPVPPGFTIATHVCMDFYKRDGKLPRSFDASMRKSVTQLEEKTRLTFGDPDRPLLLSVRSGAKFSMPGMMDTILNIGLNDRTVEGLAKMTGDPRFAYDCYRRLIQMFCDVVLDVPKSAFEDVLKQHKRERGMTTDLELTAEDMRYLVGQFRHLCRERTGNPFPEDVWTQLVMARDAVFESWFNKRAVEYRRLNHIPENLGTAVNVQTMVFGNMGPNSGTGVGFTRNPATGYKEFFGEFLLNAQGEDVVAGVRTPQPFSEMKKVLPETYRQLRRITGRLEKHYREMQDFEFTVQEGKLYMLQTRTGKRTGHAAIRIAVDMVKEKLITQQEGVLRVDPEHVEQMLHPIFDPKSTGEYNVIAKGLNASPGAAAGRAVFDADKAVALGEKGERVVLVRGETSPEDIHGMAAARGVLTATGGMTSHAAVVSRQMGKPSIVGCGVLDIQMESRSFRTADTLVEEGDFISINGSTGEVFLGDVPTVPSEITQVLTKKLDPKKSSMYRTFAEFMKWVDQYRHLAVRANADTPQGAERAIALGAEGIGLCRTEHMFFGEERIPIMRKMILARTQEDREAALAELLPFQREDFRKLFKTMGRRPVTIRMIDPPLHEFLPRRVDLLMELHEMKASGADGGAIREKEALLQRVSEISEFNPMMGFRGCRLGIMMPEITRMQARAIFEAALDVPGAVPEIMIPLVGILKELEDQKEIVIQTARDVFRERRKKCNFLVGTMIEIPRAAITADEIAQAAEFFSFGTNDLTQMTCGFSRDDAGKFLPDYVTRKIYGENPFVAVDRTGVGRLMQVAVERGRRTQPGLKIGICGEHGGEPSSVEFCHLIHLDYVSCSSFRLP